MSLRVKSLLIVLAAMALLGFVVTLITADAISDVHAQYEREVKQITRLQLEQLREELQEELEIYQGQIDFSSEKGEKLIELHAKQFIAPHNDDLQILLKDVQKSKGVLVITNDQGKIKIERAHQDLNASISDAIDRVALPLYYGGQQVGLLSFTLNTENRLESASQQIRRSLTGLSIVLLLLMLATFFFLWKTFKRHMRTSERATRLRQMAYVGTLAAGLAHEIRNPLHAMGINLSVVEEEINDPRPDSGVRMLGIVKRLREEVGELNRSVTNFLEYARPERQSPGPLDLVSLLSEVCQMTVPKLERIGGRLVWNVDRELRTGNGRGAPEAVVLGQPASLKQAFTNIATNAIQAMEEKRKKSPEALPEPLLFIGVEKRGGMFWITLRDNGPGIPKSEWKRIFEVFYSNRPGGSGFGLAIAKRAVTDHGGRIWVESEPGVGSTFYVALPAARQDVAADERP